MEKYGFVYLWYDTKRKMYYVGCHFGTVDDGYICSSNRMRDAYYRRPQDFKRRILQTGIERSKLLEEEFKWLSLIEDNELGKKYYNHSKKHFGHWSTDDYKLTTIKQRISENVTKTLSTDITKKRMSDGQKKRFEKKENHPRYGKHHSENTIIKIKEARANQIIVHSEETKRKISDSNRGKAKSREHCKALSLAHKGKSPGNKGKKMYYTPEGKKYYA